VNEKIKLHQYPPVVPGCLSDIQQLVVCPSFVVRRLQTVESSVEKKQWKNNPTTLFHGALLLSFLGESLLLN
jgi:hypothetical protein